MELLLRGWDQEIQAANRALEEAQKKRLAAEAQGAAQAAWLSTVIQGLTSQAAGSPVEISASIPGNIGVEGLIGAGTSVDELSAIISQVGSEDDRVLGAQKSAVGALLGGVVPKAGDLADIFSALKTDLASKNRRSDKNAVEALSQWEAVFREHDAQLARLSKPAHGNPQLQLWLGQEQLAIVHANVKLLEAHRPERTLRLVAHPKSLLDDPSKIVAPPSIERGPSARMGDRDFNAMLNDLPWVA